MSYSVFDWLQQLFGFVAELARVFGVQGQDRLGAAGVVGKSEKVMQTVSFHSKNAEKLMLPGGKCSP